MCSFCLFSLHTFLIRNLCIWILIKKCPWQGSFFIVAWQVSTLSQMFLHHLHSDSISAVFSVTKVHHFINFFMEAEFLEYKAATCGSWCVLGYRISIAGMVALWEHENICNYKTSPLLVNETVDQSFMRSFSNRYRLSLSMLWKGPA